jgi:hypothetical protein
MLMGVHAYAFAAIVVTALAAIAIFHQWATPGVAWIHREPIDAATVIWAENGNMFSRLASFANWKIFDASPNRLRLVSEAFEVVDAIVRPYIAAAFLHPTLSVTFAVYSLAVPAIFYRTLRTISVDRPGALLGCALLVSTSGFLSNCFLYLRPAKPLSFVVLALTILLLLRHVVRNRRTLSLALWSTLLVGMFTDELLYLSPLLVLFVALLTGTPRSIGLTCAQVMAVPLAYAVLAAIVIPPLYDLLGYPRVLSMEADYVGRGIPAMLAILALPEFSIAAFTTLLRSLAATVGITSTHNAILATSAVVLLLGCAILLWTLAGRRGPLWQAGAIAIFGATSYTAFACWTDWFNGAHFNEDVGAMMYYYHSPVVLFIVLGVCAAGKAAMDRRAEWKPLAQCAMSIAIAAVVVVNLSTFATLNHLIRVIHWGPTDLALLFDHGRHGEILHVKDLAGEQQAIALIAQLGRELFANGWSSNSMREGHRHFIRYAGAKRVGMMCRIFFVFESCPVTIEDHAGRP